MQLATNYDFESKYLVSKPTVLFIFHRSPMVNMKRSNKRKIEKKKHPAQVRKIYQPK